MIDPSLSESLLASIVLSSNDAIISKDLNGIVTSWNRAAEELYGYPAEEMIGKPVTVLAAPGRETEMPDILRRVRAGEKIDNYETVRRRKDGRLVPISLTISPIIDSRGVIRGASKIARDITEKRKQQEQVSLLMRELKHRSRNLLSICQAIVHLTKRDSVEAFKEAVDRRLIALGRVHATITESDWQGASLRDICHGEMAPFQASDKLLCEGPDLFLEPQTAQAVTLVLHELATNAAKYGAWASGTGRVHLAWDWWEKGKVLVRWTEHGGPMTSPPTKRSFGMRLIEQQARQIGGTVSFDWRPEGLACNFAISAGGIVENTASVQFSRTFPAEAPVEAR